MRRENEMTMNKASSLFLSVGTGLCVYKALTGDTVGIVAISIASGRFMFAHFLKNEA
jgi:hypothetical protein